jgi:hypothetical protein
MLILTIYSRLFLHKGAHAGLMCTVTHHRGNHNIHHVATRLLVTVKSLPRSFFRCHQSLRNTLVASSSTPVINYMPRGIFFKIQL